MRGVVGEALWAPQVVAGCNGLGCNRKPTAGTNQHQKGASKAHRSGQMRSRRYPLLSISSSFPIFLSDFRLHSHRLLDLSNSAYWLIFLSSSVKESDVSNITGQTHGLQ